jgi:hypothetical protein
MEPDTAHSGPDANSACGLADGFLAQGSLIKPGGLQLRRAALAVLLRARQPMSVVEVVRCLRDGEGIDTEWITARARGFQPFDPNRTQPDVGKVIADLLRHQVAYGRVKRVRRGVYEVNRSSLSPSTRHRCLNWRRIQAGEILGR